MIKARADTAHITLTATGFSDEAFKVTEVQGTEQMSRCFRFHVKAMLNEISALSKSLPGISAALEMRCDGNIISRYGIISEFICHPVSAKGVPVDLIITPRLSLLSANVRSTIFQNLPAGAVIEGVLRNAGLAGDDIRFEAVEGLPSRNFTVQYNESDLHFIQRLMEHYGLYYFFDHSGGIDVLVINGSGSSCPPSSASALAYHPETGTLRAPGQSVYHISRHTRIAPESVTVKDYNYMTPEVNITGRAGEGGRRGMVFFGENLSDTDEASALAAIRLEMLAAEKTVLSGQSDCRSLMPGFRFSLSDSSGSGFKGEYMVLTVSHNASQKAEGGSGEADYKNTFRCIPAAVPYRPSLTTPKPRPAGVITAKIDAPDGPYAFLDEQGRYRVKLPFDLSEKGGGQASCPVRMAQPGSGPNYGIHFPSQKDAEIILGFENGDIDRPIGLGTIPNPSSRSPVTSSNSSENIIRSAAGNEIRLTDRNQNTGLALSSAGGHRIAMEDSPENIQIDLKSAGGNQLVLNDKENHITLRTSAGRYSIRLDNLKHCLSFQTEYGHQIVLDDEQKNISLQTKDGNLISLNDRDSSITVQSGDGSHKIQIDAKANGLSVSTKGDLSLTARGTLSLKAKDIRMEADNGAVDIKAAKDIRTEGMNINIKALQKALIEGGTDTGLKGTRNLTLDAGMNMESRAGVSNRISGTMVKSEASAMNTVKGAMVMIN